MSAVKSRTDNKAQVEIMRQQTGKTGKGSKIHQNITGNKKAADHRAENRAII